MAMSLWKIVALCAIPVLFAPTGAVAQSGRTPTESAVRCIDGALRKDGRAQDKTPILYYQAVFKIDEMLDIVADCRHALEHMRTERHIIIAEYIASEAMYTSVIGLALPLGESEIFSRAEGACKEERNNNNFGKMLCGYLLGSAHEFGIGTKKDASRALQGYRSAALAGSQVAAREATRLERPASR
jgi:hypothetical protein